MTPGPELDLIASQLARRASIFACNDFAVISVESWNLGFDECGNAVWTWSNSALKPVKMGKNISAAVTTTSFLNTMTFINAWDMLIGSGKIWKSAWIAKVDPDAVFFPARLRSHLAPHTGPAQYVLNCLYGNQGRIFGAVEVFSIPAMRIYSQRRSVCKSMPWQGWGEDFYMERCMATLGVGALKDFNLVGDHRCRQGGPSRLPRS